jgi:hypothetical protein
LQEALEVVEYSLAAVAVGVEVTVEDEVGAVVGVGAGAVPIPFLSLIGIPECLLQRARITCWSQKI